MVLMPVPVNPPQMPTTSRVGLSHLHGIREADIYATSYMLAQAVY